MGKLLGGILLVSGTTVGAAMLAFPVSTGMTGFFPSLLLFLVYWCYMTFAAFCMLEANLLEPRHGNLVSMARHTLGRGGEAVSWVVYLFLLYSLMTAYVALGGSITFDVVQSLFGVALPIWATTIPLILFFGFFVYEGTRSVDLLNRLLMLGLVISYVLMALFLIPHVEGEKLIRADWPHLPIAISVVSTAFGFQIIIPTLTQYFKRDITMLKKAIFIGSVIPLIVYVIWEAVTMGVIPLEGDFGIVQGYERGDNGAKLVAAILQNPGITLLARFFSFFALMTSLLGVSISLTDFLSDGLKITKNPKGRATLFALTFLPPLLFVLTNPRAFLTALEYAGVFGVVILLGLMPALMVYSGRYYHKWEAPYRVPGGKGALIAAIVFSILVIGCELFLKVKG